LVTLLNQLSRVVPVPVVKVTSIRFSVTRVTVPV